MFRILFPMIWWRAKQSFICAKTEVQDSYRKSSADFPEIVIENEEGHFRIEDSVFWQLVLFLCTSRSQPRCQDPDKASRHKSERSWAD